MSKPLERKRWDLRELRDYVRKWSSDRQFVLSIISSLDWSDQIFRYHFCEARDSLRKIPFDDDPNSVKNHELLFASTDEHDYEMLVVRANVLACIHTARNAYDHLAQLCNALLLSPPISMKECDFSKVRTRLPQSNLRQELDKLNDSQWFKYVAAYSNASKHRALVQQSLHLSYVDGVAGLRAESFEHDQIYPPYLVGDLLEGVLEVKNHIIECGRALNSQLMPGNAE
jgi:hypothetical protein